jgi:hypothetical protein
MNALESTKVSSGPLPLPSRLKPSLPALGVASLIAAGTNAYGQIVYTQVNGGSGATVQNGSTINLNVDNDSFDPDVSVSATGVEGGHVYFNSSAFGLPVVSPGAGEGTYVALLTAGALINDSGGGGGTYFGTSNFTSLIWGSTGIGTDWGSASANTPISGYIGFTFVQSSFIRYGWLDVSVGRTPSGMPSITVFGYAYESTGNSIVAGAIPEPSAAALVLGAGALLALRQRRRKAA